VGARVRFGEGGAAGDFVLYIFFFEYTLFMLFNVLHIPAGPPSRRGSEDDINQITKSDTTPNNIA
jgi:hypothetical protein